MFAASQQRGAGAPDSELTREQLDRLDNAIAEMDQAWDDRFEFGRPKLLERYLRGELRVHLHMRGGTFERDCKDFCAVLAHGGLGRPHASDDDIRFGSVGRKILGVVDCDHRPQKDAAGDDHEQGMLVGNIVGVEDGEGGIRWIGSRVRLHPLNDCQRATGDALYYSVLAGLFKLSPSEADRELDPECRGLVPGQHKSPDKMIQAGAEVVDNLPGQHRKPQRDGFTEACKAVLSCVILVLTDNSIGFRVRPEILGNLSIEVSDILVGPLNLRPTPVEWR